MLCRHCANELKHQLLDLGYAPPSNAYLKQSDLAKPESYYPLRIMVCDNCWLVQTDDYAQVDDLFSPDYAYYSSVSSSWLAHAKRFSEKIITDLGLGPDSFVVEVASNDGYLLKNFVKAGVPCLGIEPTDGTAMAAERIGITVLRKFFGESLAERITTEGRLADLIIANNVYAHVPDINDFSRGLKLMLKSGGTITLEFPHLMKLIEFCQFDTIYHEHFSYLSLHTVNRILKQAGLRVLDVEVLSTHGGSLRIYACHESDSRKTLDSVQYILDQETAVGLQSLTVYRNFQVRTNKVKNDVLSFLIQKKNQGKSVVAYGAAAKGNTLLNYAGVKLDLISYVFDSATSKQDKFMPGSHIPILNPILMRDIKPDIVLILPWNLAEEISSRHSYISEWGGEFVVAVPTLQAVGG